MRTVVCFRASTADYCVPVEAARAVRDTSRLVELPAPRAGVAGLLPGDPPLTVLAPFGRIGHVVLVVEAGDKTFGLLVESVTGLRQVEEADIRLAPGGQDVVLISGTISTADGHLTMLADPSALAARL